MSISFTIPDAVVCHCYDVRETELRAAIDATGVASVEEVTNHTSAGGGCTACHCRSRRMLAGLPARCRAMDVCATCGFASKLCACEAA